MLPPQSFEDEACYLFAGLDGASMMLKEVNFEQLILRKHLTSLAQLVKVSPAGYRPERN